MMGLEILNVDTLLAVAVQTSLRGAVTYGDLRSKSLTIAPIQSIVTDVTNRVDTIAEQDISEATTQLTIRAHSQQIDQDAWQERNDKEKGLAYQREKLALEIKISDLSTELFSVNALYFVHQLTHSGAQGELQRAQTKVAVLEKQISSIQSENTHHHGHGHGQVNEHQHQHNQHSSHPKLHHLESELQIARQQVSRLHDNERREYQVYYQHDRNKNRIESELSISRARISELLSEQRNMDTREVERSRRRSTRESHPDSLIREALSAMNANQLDGDIQRSSSSINNTCRQIKVLANLRCYPVFLNQLSLEVDTLSLPQNERTALKQIIAKMNEHQRDVLCREQSETALFELNAQLQSKRKNHADKQSEVGLLSARNEELKRLNSELNSKLPTLHSSHAYLLEQRNFYTKSSLAAVGITGAGTVTAYFLIQAGIISLVPAANIIIAAVIGTVLMGLIITTCVDAVRTSIKHSEINACSQTIANNTTIISKNIQTMNQSLGADLPVLVSDIKELEQKVGIQTTATEQARQKEQLSLSEAHAIKVPAPNFGNSNSSSFFASSALPCVEGSLLPPPYSALPQSESVSPP